MTHAHADPTTQSLWTRIAARLAAFVRAYLTAAQFAQMREAPAVLVRDALVRVWRLEALVRRVLFAQALGVRVESRPLTPRAKRDACARTPAQDIPLEGDPSTWRVHFHLPLPPLPHAPTSRTPRTRAVRHPLLLRPERLPRLPQKHRPYDPVVAAKSRARVKARAEAAYNAYWYAPYPPPPEPEGPMWIELPLSNEPVDVLPTAALARRIEALHRVLADPAPHARRLAVRLARRPTHAPRVLAHWQARTRRRDEGEETLCVAARNVRGAAHDSS